VTQARAPALDRGGEDKVVRSACDSERMRGPGSDTTVWTDLRFVWDRVCRKQSRTTKGMLFIEYGIDSH